MDSTGLGAGLMELTRDVFEAAFEFSETARLIIDMIDPEADDKSIHGAVETLRDIVGRDPAKLFSLIDTVHGKLLRQWNWATGAAVRFYT